jgi:predicted neuraminidase
VLVAAWFGGTAEGKPDVGIWLSRRERDHWSKPVEVANGVGETPPADGPSTSGGAPAAARYPCWNPVLFQPRSGDLMLFYKVGPHPSKWWGLLRTSSDHGRTWSAPRKLPAGILGPIKNKPVQLSRGDLLCPTSNEENGWRVHFERSSDGGRSWVASSPLNDGKTIGAIQPSVLFLGGEKLRALGRTKQGRVFQVDSFDGGNAWGEMTLTDLPNPNSGTDAVTLKDGRHLLIYNHTARGRSPLNLAISADGQKWEAALVLEDEPNAEFSYPAIIQGADGKVQISYTWKRQKIKHTVLDPANLRPTSFEAAGWSTPPATPK